LVYIGKHEIQPLAWYKTGNFRESLEREHLKDDIRGNSLRLDTKVSEASDNFVVGQRHLLSLSRSLLHRLKILVLYEAMVVADVATDALIQKPIREEFRELHSLGEFKDHEQGRNSCWGLTEI